MIYHIPPGIDGHSSSTTKQVVTMWKPAYADGFNKLLDQYRKTIELNLAGHTHLDDIRLIKTEHTQTLVLINPGVSPNIGQNPAFRVITVDSQARLQDMMTYYIPNLQALKWELEYSARQAYGLKKIDANSYQALYRQIDQSPSVSDKWKMYYAVSRPAGLADSKTYLRSLYCATGNSSAEAFQTCLSGH
jgi:sphingomyelin phosphodiesterase